jgi:O-antigen ligase
MPSADEHGHPLWRSSAARLAFAAIPLFTTIAVVTLPVPYPIVPWPIKLAVAAVFGVTVLAPHVGLLMVAAGVPFGDLAAVLLGLPVFRLSEAIVLAFVAGWLIRGEADRPGPSVPSTLAWLLSALVASSIAAQAWTAGYRAFDVPGLFQFFRVYYLTGEHIGFVAGVHIVEGLALAAATVMLFRQHPRLAETLPAATIASAAVAAAASTCLYYGIGPAEALARDARFGFRAAHLPDVNAAGCYFGMSLCLAMGMAARTRGRGLAFWSAGAVAAFAGLRLSESRSALYATLTIVALALALAATARWPLRVRVAGLAALLCLALALGYARTRIIERDPTFQGAGFRQQFNATSLRMIRTRPLFGLGVGQYYLSSSLFLSPELAFTYGLENAHNYFLQVGAELGVAGLALLVMWIGVVLVRSAGAVSTSSLDWRLLGTAGGLAIVCAASLPGHPLLVDEVMFPFWILFGLTAGLSGSALWNPVRPDAREHGASGADRPRWVTATAMGAIFIASTAVSATRPPLAPAADAAVDGFYAWETAEDGTRFRWASQYASLFVPADVRAVRVPMRMPASARAVGPIGVEVRSWGLSRGRVLIGDAWTEAYVPLGDVPVPKGYRRVDLRVDRAWQPALYIPGSADLRSVGVQVGEPRFEHYR